MACSECGAGGRHLGGCSRAKPARGRNDPGLTGREAAALGAENTPKGKMRTRQVITARALKAQKKEREEKRKQERKGKDS